MRVIEHLGMEENNYFSLGFIDIYTESSNKDIFYQGICVFCKSDYKHYRLNRNLSDRSHFAALQFARLVESFVKE